MRGLPSLKQSEQQQNAFQPAAALARYMRSIRYAARPPKMSDILSIKHHHRIALTDPIQQSSRD
jgi:hypothetical protein